METTTAYDLLIITDATGSMTSFLRSLNDSIPEIIRLAALTGCFGRIGLLAYRDYEQVLVDRPVIVWSGWYSQRSDLCEIDHDSLLSTAMSLQPISNSQCDFPEASKTALAKAYSVMRPDATTVIILYADAPPHMKNGTVGWQYSNWYEAEQQELQRPDSPYGPSAACFADWIHAGHMLADAKKKAIVFSIIDGPGEALPYYAYLSARTGGTCLKLPRNDSTSISALSVGLIMAWMGATKQCATLSTERLANHIVFEGGKENFELGELGPEDDPRAQSILKDIPRSEITFNPRGRGCGRDGMCPSSTRSRRMWSSTVVTLEALNGIVPRRKPPIVDFSKRYREDEEYRKLVVAELSGIIDSNVLTMALNPVFSSLWRAVCSDRKNPAREELVTRFSQQVDKISNAQQQARMKKWLEESYDFVGEILHTILSVPEDARFPCVFLDPTLRFEPSSLSEDTSTTFTRDELLEIGRSCDARILRRMGRVLTRLTYVDTADALPTHILAAPDKDVPRVPMALASPKYGRKFWRILLHTILPGTMLGSRPAALLAALSLRMGIKPLEQAALEELVHWRDKWNTLDFPETWSLGCLQLLLEADKKAQAAGMPDGVLKDVDRRMFETLVDYKLLEFNLDTKLTARLGWTPNKTKSVLGPIVMCRWCGYSRSVTIMAGDGVCGRCLKLNKQLPVGKTADEYLAIGVSKSYGPETQASWVECSMAECRAQYVVYDIEGLRARPKCHYCRNKGIVSQDDPAYPRLTTAPCVTCSRCLNRVIWPKEYRPADFDAAAYVCPACVTAPDKTIIDEEITPRKLMAENGLSFLLRNDDAVPGDVIFNGRSIFALLSPLSPEQRAALPEKLVVLPALQAESDLTLTINGKPLHNTLPLLRDLNNWISSRSVQTHTCTLCFDSFAPSLLRLACGGRRGCRQPICAGCVDGWYGVNAPGRVINTSALCCPFCRRMPRGNGVLPARVRFLAGLGDAVREKGEWVYGWCRGCGTAKRFAERRCAAGVTDVPEGWLCKECEEQRASEGLVRGKEKEFVVKMCPRCGVATEKVIGCDHITCPCGAHWCFYCGQEKSAEEIYRHMAQEHGGWYNGAPWMEEDVEEEEIFAA